MLADFAQRTSYMPTAAVTALQRLGRIFYEDAELIQARVRPRRASAGSKAVRYLPTTALF
jgi:hypothetical protein